MIAEREKMPESKKKDYERPEITQHENLRRITKSIVPPSEGE
jgi:hypothetical protein